MEEKSQNAKIEYWANIANTIYCYNWISTAFIVKLAKIEKLDNIKIHESLKKFKSYLRFDSFWIL